MNDKLTDDMHDEILNFGRFIRQAQKLGHEASINTLKYHSKEAKEALSANNKRIA